MKVDKGSIYHAEGHDACQDLHSHIFIPEEDMNAIEKAVYDEIRPYRIKTNLLEMMDSLTRAYTNIRKNAKKTGNEDDFFLEDEDHREFMKKILNEGVNSYIYAKVREVVMAAEKCYSK